ncbi:glycosyltransferase [Flavobacterium notoginsengisoli]|uniref:glycosyltransferase n=1 Tax=Flavobacterium notoginsengisoli TaxID=1478199 RepID=UPI0036326D4B
MNEIGIVIPFYKLNFFEETLKSLQNQTNQRFKVYIGDDASPDNPLPIIEKYQNHFNIIYKRFDNNLGRKSLTQQWERCINLTVDEQWLMILGDDDFLSNNVIESFYEVINEVEKEKINVIRFATQKVNEKGIAISHVVQHPEKEKSVNFLFNNTRSSLSEYVFKRTEFKLGFKDFPLAWYSDILAVFEFSNYGNIFTINKAILYIRISILSISGNFSNEKLKRKAKFQFYYYLIDKRLEMFSDSQAKELYCRINKCFVNNKKYFIYFLQISKLYIYKKLFKQYFIFVKQIFVSVIR